MTGISLVVRFFMVHDAKPKKRTKSTQNVSNGHKISQLAIRYIYKGCPSKIYPNWNFWLENKPSVIPDLLAHAIASDFSVSWQFSQIEANSRLLTYVHKKSLKSALPKYEFSSSRIETLNSLSQSRYKITLTGTRP
jgi:hypothetical protein